MGLVTYDPFSQDRTSIIKRLEKHKLISGRCWLWIGSTSRGGHGKMTILYKQYEVSRVSACLFLDLDIYDSTQLACHKIDCPNSSCFNPDHLYIGNKRSNMIDCILSGNARGTNIK